MHNHLSSTIFLFALILYPINLYSADFPSNWPWRGINIISSQTTSDDVRFLKSQLNLNSLRLTLKPRFLARSEKIHYTVAWEKTLAWADQIIETCKSENIACIIHISEFPIDPESGLRQDDPSFWNNPVELQKVRSLTAEIASRFKHSGDELAAYQILSEPLVRKQKSNTMPAAWIELQNSIVKTIRDFDPERWICATPGPGGLVEGYENFLPLSHKKIIYTAHMYTPHGFTHEGLGKRPRGLRYPGRYGMQFIDHRYLAKNLSILKQFQDETQVPVWISEFSAVRWAAGSEQYLRDLVMLFNQYSWGWAYHCYNCFDGWDPHYGNQFDARTKHEIMHDDSSTPRWNTLKALFNR